VPIAEAVTKLVKNTERMGCVLGGRHTAVTWLSPRVESAAVPTAPSAPIPEPCPCDACRFSLRCDAEHLACVAFSLFMAGKSAVRWKLAPRVPTRARYEAVLGGDVGQLSGV